MNALGQGHDTISVPNLRANEAVVGVADLLHYDLMRDGGIAEGGRIQDSVDYPRHLGSR